MFLEDFKNSLPKLLIMKKKEEQEELEKRLKDVKKLILKRKRKLEINESLPDPFKSVNRKSQASLPDTKTVEAKNDDLTINTDANQKDKSPRVDPITQEKAESTKQPIKSKGGDPYGALQKLENEELERFRKEQEESRQNTNLRSRQSMQKSESEVNLQPQVLATESDMPEITEEKPIVSKVDPETLKKRMEEDKEINALNEEKDRIIGLIEEYKDAYYDEEEFRKEAYNMIQCHDPHKYRKRIVGFISPFGTTDKDERVNKEEKSKRYKFKSKEDKELIKARVKEIKTLRENEKKKKEQEKEELYQKNRNLMKNLHYKLLKDKDGNIKEGAIPAFQARSEEQAFDVSRSKPVLKLNQISPSRINIAPGTKPSIKLPNKFTLESLGQFKLEDLAEDGEDQLNLAEIVDENNDGSDDEILRRYKKEERKISTNQVPKSPLRTQDKEEYQPPNQNKIKNKGVTQREKDVIKEQVQKQRVSNNSAVNNVVASIPKTLSKKELISYSNSKSKQNLLAKSHEVSSIIKKKGPTSDDEKIYKNKLANKGRKIELSSDARHSEKKNYGNPSQSPPRNNNLSYIPKSVKRDSTKISLAMAIADQKPSNKGKFSSIKANNSGMINHKVLNNITIDTYDRANKLETKAKRNQEERLQNILKMHDNNMKRGVGIANKGRIL